MTDIFYNRRADCGACGVWPSSLRILVAYAALISRRGSGRRFFCRRACRLAARRERLGLAHPVGGDLRPGRARRVACAYVSKTCRGARSGGRSTAAGCATFCSGLLMGAAAVCVAALVGVAVRRRSASRCAKVGGGAVGRPSCLASSSCSARLPKRCCFAATRFADVDALVAACAGARLQLGHLRATSTWRTRTSRAASRSSTRCWRARGSRVAYWRTRSLWFPLGLHFGWNWVQGAMLGSPVSGITRITPDPLMRFADAGPRVDRRRRLRHRGRRGLHARSRRSRRSSSGARACFTGDAGAEAVHRRRKPEPADAAS